MSLRASAAAFALVPVLLLAGIAYAHDMWLRADAFMLAPGDTLAVHQLVGHDLEAETEVQLLRTMTPRFDLVTPEGTIDLLAGLPDLRSQPYILPVLERRLDVEGLALVVMDHAFIYNEFSREEFVAYLRHEADDSEATLALLGDSASQSERYARSFKALVQVGASDGDDLHARPVGQKLELLLLQNPYLLDPGDSLDVRVLFDGRPLAGERVTALNEGATHTHGADSHTHATEARAHAAEAHAHAAAAHAVTDADGVARFGLDTGGLWMIRMVHLYPAPVSDTDWESYWASYTFWVD